MKRIVHASLLLCAVALLAGSCKKDSNSPTPSANVPIVTTVAVSSIAITTAISGGIVLSDSGSSVTARGVCWSTSPNPTVTGNKTTDGSGLGSFTSNLTGLTANTTYYIRAYATNAKGTGYGNEVTFATQPLSTLTVQTTAITNITATTASSGGTVNTTGGASITARGVCWSTNANPTLADSYTSDGIGAGTFSSSIIGLMANTVYHVRAYATNITGTVYGSDLSFTTLHAVSFNCGSTLTINHVAGAVAPVTKTVTYGTVTNIPGLPTKCWITSNLGADHRATAVDDTTEASAGWYWQFNRKQGYKHNGITRTPNTAWISSISGSSNWIAANDPCTLELGSSWRLPTTTEWENVSNLKWRNRDFAWLSGLWLHAAGSLHGSDGSLFNRGDGGVNWSNEQYSANLAWEMEYYQFNCNTMMAAKEAGFNVCCIKD